MNYQYTKVADPEFLQDQIKASSLSGFVGLMSIGDQIEVLFNTTLSNSDKTILDGLIDSHNPALSPYVIARKVNKGREKFGLLVDVFIAENILMGITQAGKTKLVADTLKDVFYYGQLGSLYEVISAIDAVVVTEAMSPFITTERLNSFKVKVQEIVASL